MEAYSRVRSSLARQIAHLSKIASFDPFEVQDRLLDVEKIKEQLLDNHDDLIKTCKAEDVDSYSDECAVLMDSVSSIIGKLRIAERDLPVSASLTSSSSSVSSHPAPYDIRPPRMELPTFDGTTSAWPAFSTLFMDGINAYPNLSGAQKLMLLTTSLRGPAKNVVSFIPPADTAFDEAWKLLMKKYDDERTICYDLVNKILLHPNVSRPEDIEKFVDTLREVLRALSLLKQPPPPDVWLNAIILTKLDAETKTAYARSLSDNKIPASADFVDFLHIWAKTKSVPTQQKPQQQQQRQAPNQNQNKPATKTKCPECSLEHMFYRCPVYNKATVDDRWALAKKHNMCTNCLTNSHKISVCPSKLLCNKCQKKHNSSLHKDETKVTATISSKSSVLLATAIVYIKNSNNKFLKLRALIDGGASLSLISSKALAKLGITASPANVSFLGPTGQSSTSHEAIACTINDNKKIFQMEANLQVVPQIATELPGMPIDQTFLESLIKGKHLADPTYHKPAPVDLLLGVDYYAKVLLPQLDQSGNLLAQRTRLGWILFGTLPSAPLKPPKPNVIATVLPDFSKFWEIEDLPTQRFLTKEEEAVEDHFSKNVQRLNGGRFQVRLPLKQDPPQIGASRHIALKRFQSLENKFKREPSYQKVYNDVMTEYFTLQHIEEVPASDLNSRNVYYIPHHAVKKEGASTPLRIVFDASAKGSLGRSLNEELLNGPVLQNNIFTVLTKFRTYTVALSADIQKMYRQVLVHPDDRNLQRILWRPTPNSVIKDYRLKTVTFGVKTAPYLAIRVLHELANEAPSENSKLAMLSDFYVDDFLSGANSVEEALQLKKEVQETLHSGGFPCHKWASNSQAVLQSVNEGQSQISLSPKDESLKTLGLLWDPKKDTFAIKISKPSRKWTRRSVLSVTNGLYDPLGIVAPVTLTAKIILQNIVKSTTDWDEPLSKEQTAEWEKWIALLPSLEKVNIPRCLSPHASSATLIGFCDASERAYGAVVYCRSPTPTGFQITFVAAKTKVVPLKQVSLPRLELMAAVLLANLLKAITDSTVFSLQSCLAYSDSTVALAWLKQHPSKWETFVANRVSQVQKIITPDQWQHVRGIENPADLASRGVPADELHSSSIWWKGPTWLSSTTKSPSDVKDFFTDISSRHQSVVATAVPIDNVFKDTVSKFSTWKKLRKVFALIFLYKDILLKKCNSLQTVHYQRADNFLINIVQNEHFAVEFFRLRKKEPVLQSSPIASLNPFVDNNGLLRVGGRLKNSQLSDEQKHPIILPARHHVTRLIIEDAHIKCLHAGPSLTQGVLRQNYWILQPTRTVKSILSKCVRCARCKGVVAKQMMADLPVSRVTPTTRPFQRCGVDFAGPFPLKTHLTRGTKNYKGYVSLFICFTTRAIHAELVTALSTPAFLAAFARFVSRRGLPAHVYSDQGTNFKGAHAELEKISSSDEVKAHMAAINVMWHFNPPNAPHFGGLWEAGVKSLKTHLSRVIGSTPLTYEEFSTVLCRTEAALNSRPLLPLSNDPEGLEALTPAHFLIGGPLHSVPEDDLTELRLNSLSRWQLVQRLSQNIWNRWHQEYLTRLQNRPRWWRKCPNLRPGSLVLLQDSNHSPLHWRLARILTVHPGDDGAVRVATLKTAHGEMQRPVHRLCPLPLDEE